MNGNNRADCTAAICAATYGGAAGSRGGASRPSAITRMECPPFSASDAAHAAFDHFVALYEAKYPKAGACLQKDHDASLAFYDFPAELRLHLRTMVFKLALSAPNRCRRLNGHDLIQDVIRRLRDLTLGRGIRRKHLHRRVM